MTLKQLYEKLSDLKRQAAELCDETIDKRNSVSSKTYRDMSESEQDRYYEFDSKAWALENCCRHIDEAMYALYYHKEGK